MSDEAEFKHTGRPIEDEIRIDAPPEAVYRAWTDPDAISGWFVSRMEGRVEEGETIEWFWGEESGPGMTHEVVVADAPHHLVMKMALPQGASYLEITIEQEEGRSVVRLVQSGFGEGPEWDDQFEAMRSGWMIAMGVLKFFLERYGDRDRREIAVLADSEFEDRAVADAQRSEGGVIDWLAESGTVGATVGEPVKLVLGNGQTLTGRVLRTTVRETLWSWKEIEGVLEIKAFRGAAWGSKIGVRVSSWAEDPTHLTDVEGWLEKAVQRLAESLESE